MSRPSTSFVLGYHGCDRELGLRTLAGGLTLEQSSKSFDWLGPGVYFWENDPQRALEWAQERAHAGLIGAPFVIGAVIDLGNGLDLLVRENLDLLATAYKSLAKTTQRAGLPLPVNRDPKAINKGDKLLRYRDCAVIRHLHTMIDDATANPIGGAHVEPFDTVRGLFVEGARAYPGSGFFVKTHTQIAVRRDRCIRGVFAPR